jgi:polysaccharide biosynthesis/export protein
MNSKIMPLLKRIVFLLISVGFLMVGCIPIKDLEYVQGDISDSSPSRLPEPPIQRIKPNDELYIRVSSLDEVAYNFFGNQSEMRTQTSGTEISVALISYLVDDSGYIQFPILDKIHLAGLTIEEATVKLKTSLAEYFNQPTVLMKFVNKRITILGEVRRPGLYLYTSSKMNIFEALGLAGDITIDGNRKEVLVLREVKGQVFKQSFNLLNDDLLSNAQYNLQEGDIVYVKAKKSATWRTVSTPMSMFLGSLTAAVLIAQLFLIYR